MQRSGSHVRLVALLIALGATLAIGVPTAAAARTFASFFSPSGNVGCVMGTATVRCISKVPNRRVDLFRNGTMKICRNSPRCPGDLGEGSFELKYGKSVRVGGFRCTSRKTGMTCIRIGSGKGFRMSRAGVKRLP